MKKTFPIWVFLRVLFVGAFALFCVLIFSQREAEFKARLASENQKYYNTGAQHGAEYLLNQMFETALKEKKIILNRSAKVDENCDSASKDCTIKTETITLILKK